MLHCKDSYSGPNRLYYSYCINVAAPATLQRLSAETITKLLIVQVMRTPKNL